MTVETVSTDQVKNIALGGIVAVVVIGLILALLVKALVGRIVLLVVVVALGVFLWGQRVAIEHRVKDCKSNVSFLGFHAKLSQSVQARCQKLQQVTNR